ncbi:WD repeat and HMG-box DNA-binding protein 1-like isoform X2 [Haliotis rufescens]|uniref:WD repeat and HMG-box DNA-binding protein 1-like isoform X2 n=1 Tax=Haliotis rufescens TaxID=6454 RepID=UPI00201F77C8|nr:WD repeat and HMG-box DNA-binding protein 1-like isoform X2 [Haliotis rufescens]
MKPMRYAHSDGHTVLCFDDSGRYMLTGGTDGDVRVWQGIDDDDAVSHRVGEKVYAVAFKNNRFYTASEANSVQTHTFPDGSPDGIVTRFTGAVSHMCLNKSGSVMVAASSDFTVKHVEVETSNQKVFHGHQAPVLSVSLHPQEELLASSSCDGSVKVWKVADQSCVKSLEDSIPKCSDISLSKTLCRLTWSPDGKNLLVPREKEIAIYENNTWQKSVITHEALTGTVSILTFSPPGNLLAAACCDGSIVVFDWNTRKCVEKQRHDKGLNICALAWNPSNSSQLALCDTEGQLGVLDLATTDKPDGDEQMNAGQFAGVFDDDDDLLLEASNVGPGNDDEGTPDPAEGETPSTKKSQPLIDDDDEDDDDGDFLKDIKLLPKDDDASSIADSLPPPATIVPTNTFKPTPMQRPFQPGSTPSHLSSRYMVWNDVGIVKQYVSDEENSIDVEFHSTATHHAMHLTNSLDCHLATLTSTALVLACSAEDDVPSKVMCMHFGSWDSSKEWTVCLPEGEEAQAVTAGAGWVAVATDARNLRIFSEAGVQQDLFSIPGPVVSLAGHDSTLLITYHAGMGIPGDQFLGVIITEVGSQKKTLLNGSPLSMSPKSTLQWLGFSSEGTPFSMDSAGIVRRMSSTGSPTWIQVADTQEHAKGKSDHYWIVGVGEHPQQLRCIPCKGARYPPTLPRPAVSVIPFRLPMCEMNTEKSQYEETFLRTCLFASSLRVPGADNSDLQEALRPAQEALIKLFALSARSDREARALEVCEMMQEEHTMQLAIKYASRLKHMQLAQRISELAQRRAEEEDEEEEVVEESEDIACSRRNGSVAQHDEENMEEEDEEADVEEEDDTDHSTGPKLNLQPREVQAKTASKSVLARSNPFKVSSQRSIGHPTKGSQVFDKLSSKTDKSDKPIVPLPVTIRTSKSGGSKKTKTISNMFSKNNSADSNASSHAAEPKADPETQNSKPSVSGFQLWLEENREELEEERPDLSHEDLSQVAAERFRALPKEERQTWSQKAKSKSAATTSPDGRKRKRVEEDSSEKPSKKSTVRPPLSQSTNTKLSSFAFSKD